MANKIASPQDSILETHKKVNDLLQRIGFYQDELKVYEHRLEEVVSKNTGKDILAQAEHFQNQFIIEKDQLNELKHEVNLLKDVLDKLAKEPAWAALRLQKGGLQDKMTAAEKVFAETRTKFYRFLATVY